MAYFVTAAIVVVLGVSWWLVTEARRETRLVARPHERSGRRATRRSRLMETGDGCSCGGVLGPSGRESEKFGPLLGCTGCSRSWTLTGQRVRRRTVPPQTVPPHT